MANNIQTVYQRLEKMFGSNGYGQPTDYSKKINSYGVNGDNVIFRTKDKEEYEKKKLELRQQHKMSRMWKKASYDIANNSLAGLTDVKLMYRDADLMDGFPEIGAALDIYMEEACFMPNNGMLVNVSSKSERIKSILQDLLVNRLSINTVLPMVCRSTCKYGNTFMLLNFSTDNGIIGWKQLPVYEMERYENGMSNPYMAGFSASARNDMDVDDSTKFVWVGSSEYTPYRNWQIAHFRMLYDSIYLPYGVSILNKARRHFRMLSMMEDMMLLYRLERSVERRVFKINVGAIDEQDVPAYMDQIANEFKRTPIVDPMTGQLDLRKNIMPVWKNTPIPLLDGRTITIEQLANEYENGKENYVYSIQEGTHQLVPGKVVWCGKNYTANKMIKVTLDDGGYIVLAPEHEFIMRDGSRKRADEVKLGDSVMPFYTECKKDSLKRMERYEKVYNPNAGKYEFTHRLVANEVEKPIFESKTINTVHHIDYNKYNNNPTNLLWCNFHDHKKMHSEVSKNNWKDPLKRQTTISKLSKSRIDYYQKHGFPQDTKNKISTKLKEKYANGEMEHCRALASANIKKYLASPQCSENVRRNNYLRQSWKAFEAYNKSELHKKHDEIRRKNKIEFWRNGDTEHAKRAMTVCFDAFIWEEVRHAILNGIIYNRNTMLEYINTKLIEHLLEINTNKRLHKLNRISREVLETRIHEIGFTTITEYIASIKKNHKIVKIETIEGDDVYCMTVEGLNGEDDRHNFAVCGIDSSNGKSGCFVSNCQMDDFFIPVRDDSAPNPIETLQAAQNMSALDDIKYVQNKVFTALRVPKPFLNFEETAGEGKNLSLLDVRFTRTVNRVQNMMLMELNKICMEHLMLLGFTDDLTNFTLTMNNPSSQAEMMEIENMTKKIQTAKDAISDAGNGIPLFSVTRAWKEIMGWSEKEIEDNLEELRLEKALSAELENTAMIIKRTGLFDPVDNIYGEPGADYQQMQQGGPDDEMGGAPGGGGFGGGFDMGGGDLDLGGMPEEGDMAGAEGEMGMDAAADEEAGLSGDNGGGESDFGGPVENLMTRKLKNLITEQQTLQNKLLDKSKKYTELLKAKRNEKALEEEKKMAAIPLFDKTFMVNEELNSIFHKLNGKK